MESRVERCRMGPPDCRPRCFQRSARHPIRPVGQIRKSAATETHKEKESERERERERERWPWETRRSPDRPLGLARRDRLTPRHNVNVLIKRIPIARFRFCFLLYYSFFVSLVDRNGRFAVTPTRPPLLLQSNLELAPPFNRVRLGFLRLVGCAVFSFFFCFVTKDLIASCRLARFRFGGFFKGFA